MDGPCKKSKCSKDLHTLRAADAELDALAGQIQAAAATAVSASVNQLDGTLPSRVLVTGSAGYLGATLVQALRKCNVATVGLDIVSSNTTDIVGSVTDEETVETAARDCQAIIHTAALHAPHADSHDEESFRNVNVRGTRNILAAARAREPDAAIVVHSSTTSLTITPRVKADEAAGTCVWLTENSTHPAADITNEENLPRNKYGRTKLDAEKACLEAASEGVPVVILRVSRCFPEDVIDVGEKATASLPNFKANELLGRRVSLQDTVDAHLRALVRAQRLRGSLFTLAAPVPWTRDQTPSGSADFAKFVSEKLPHMRQIFESRGWKPPEAISRVYDSSSTVAALDWQPRWTFAKLLSILEDKDVDNIEAEDARLGRY